jgi:hypothetical protein
MHSSLEYQIIKWQMIIFSPASWKAATAACSLPRNGHLWLGGIGDIIYVLWRLILCISNVLYSTHRDTPGLLPTLLSYCSWLTTWHSWSFVVAILIVRKISCDCIALLRDNLLVEILCLLFLLVLRYLLTIWRLLLFLKCHWWPQGLEFTLRWQLLLRDVPLRLLVINSSKQHHVLLVALLLDQRVKERMSILHVDVRYLWVISDNCLLVLYAGCR